MGTKIIQYHFQYCINYHIIHIIFKLRLYHIALFKANIVLNNILNDTRDINCL